MAVQPASREAHYAELMSYARGQGNDDALARIHASWATGASALPSCWGLSPAAFRELLDSHFQGYRRGHVAHALTVQPVDPARAEEVGELEQLMIAHRARRSPSERWIACIVATDCLGSDHLWQDLGLWCRDDLSCLMQRNFPALAAKNVHNMKWKKFLYKQLCEAEGVYLCRAPSCEVCADYPNCFGAED